MRHFVTVCSLVFLSACGPPRAISATTVDATSSQAPAERHGGTLDLDDTSSGASSWKPGPGDKVRTIAIDAGTAVSSEVSDDDSYGYTEGNAVKVGGSLRTGPLNERRFLDSLAGPRGETVRYVRLGSCCPFQTPNGMFGGGLLDRYEVVIEGVGTRILFLNMYDPGGTLKIPVGFTMAEDAPGK